MVNFKFLTDSLRLDTAIRSYLHINCYVTSHGTNTIPKGDKYPMDSWVTTLYCSIEKNEYDVTKTVENLINGDFSKKNEQNEKNRTIQTWKGLSFGTPIKGPFNK